MGFLTDAGYFAGGLASAWPQAYGAVRGAGLKQQEINIMEAYRKAQVDALEQAQKEKQDLADALKEMMTPIPGPTPEQQQKMAGSLLQDYTPTQTREKTMSNLTDFNLPGQSDAAMPLPSSVPVHPWEQKTQELANAGTFQQQYFQKPWDTADFFKTLIQKNPSQAHYYAMGLASLLAKQGVSPQEWIKDVVVSGKWTPESASVAYPFVQKGDIQGALSRLVAMEKPGNTLTPFMTKGKNPQTVLLDMKDPKSQDKINAQGLIPVPISRTEVFLGAQQGVPGAAPGIMYEKGDGRPYLWMSTYKLDKDGNPIQDPDQKMYLNSEQVQLYTLHYKEALPTETMRTMQTFAPGVIDLANKLKGKVEEAAKANGLGPMSSRFRELWASKIGSDDPLFTAIRTNSKLLSSLLMRMHVGARGGWEMLNHFEGLMNTAVQSPANIYSAITEINSYANKVKQSKVGEMLHWFPKGGKGGVSGGGSSTGGWQKNANGIWEMGG
jgi:hypothetical protein